MFKILPLYLVLFFFSDQVISDSEISPYAKVDAADTGRCYFKQVPPKLTLDDYGELKVEREPSGAAYQVEETGPDTKLWEVSSWYAFTVFLSRDCQHLVRMGNWARGVAPSAEDVAVEFCKAGALLKRYSTEDLIKNKRSVSRSVSHYQWQSDDPEYPKLEGYSGLFHLMTIEGVHYTFNIKDGELVETP